MKLKNNILGVLILIVVTLNCHSQSKTLELSEGFVAFIVKDMQTSIDWYVSNLGFTIVNQVNLEERGIKQANLELGETKIELIESKSSIDPLKMQTNKGLIQGIFKVGFMISDFDAWEKHLLQRKLITKDAIVQDPLSKKRMLIIKDPDGNRIQLFEN